MGYDQPLGGSCHRHEEKEGAATGKIEHEWPDIGSRAVKIPTNDYVKLYGMWRGSIDETLPGQDAIFKFIQAENLQRLSIKREMKQLKRPPSGLQIKEIAGVKLVRGKPFAYNPVPWNGERFDVLVKEPLPKRPASTQPEHEKQELEGAKAAETTKLKATNNKSEGSRAVEDSRAARAQRRRDAAPPPLNPKDLRSYLVRPHSFGRDRALLWKDPKYEDARPKVDCSKRTNEDVALDTKSVRELLGRPATSDHLEDTLKDGAKGKGVRELIEEERASRQSTAASRSGTSLSRVSTAHSSRLGTGAEWNRYNRTEKWNKNNTVEVIGEQGGFCVIKQKKKVKNTLGAGVTDVDELVVPSRNSTPGKKLDMSWMATIPNCGRITDPFQKDAQHLTERYYVPLPRRDNSDPRLHAAYYE